MSDRSAAPDSPAAISALAREHGVACIAVLVEALDSPSPGERIAAALALLDLGHGRPVQPLAFDTTGAHVEVHTSEPPGSRPNGGDASSAWNTRLRQRDG